MDMEFLKELANLDIRDQASPEQQQILRENKDAWRQILLQMKRDSDFQMASSKAECAEKKLELSEEEFAAYEARRLRWRANSIRFKNGVENRLAEIGFSSARQLIEAIEDHKRNVLSAGSDDDTAEFDDRLWSVVE